MDQDIINNEPENSSISLKESYYCSSPKIGVKSESNKNNNENNEYMNLFKDTNMKSNNFTFRLSEEKSTDFKSKEKEKDKNEFPSYKKYLTNKKNNKIYSVNKFISQPIIYEKNYEDENFISHSITKGKMFLYKSSSNSIKEKDRKNENIYLLENNYRKSRKKLRKNTDNINTHKNRDFSERKKIKKKFSLVNNNKKTSTNKEIGNYFLSSQRLITNNIKLEKNRRKELKLKSCITLKGELSSKEKKEHKNINKISRINSINEKLLKNIYSFDKSNSNNKNPIVKKENNKYIKKYSSNLELKKYKSMDIKIKFDMINQDSSKNCEKLILNYKNKKEIIEILSDKENINNYYEYMEICLETLQDMNIKEVPKSNYKLKFTFPKELQKKKLVLFDLDETLVHCVGEISEKNQGGGDSEPPHKIKVLLPNKKEIFIGINIRPHWKESLDKIKNIYNIIIFTASHRNYSDAVLNYLDPDNQYFKYRLYRDSCVLYKTNDVNFYVKDLDIFKNDFDLKDIVIIDNSILSFAYHLNNGIPVVPFYDSQIDIELPLLSYYLLSIANYNDLRIANQEHIKLEFFLKQIKQIKYQEIESISTKKNFSPIEFKEVKGNNDKNSIKDDKLNDIKKENKSEKKIFHFSNFNRVFPELKRLNTIDNNSDKNIDFFEKWKYAYLKLSSKK